LGIDVVARLALSAGGGTRADEAIRWTTETRN